MRSCLLGFLSQDRVRQPPSIGLITPKKSLSIAGPLWATRTLKRAQAKRAEVSQDALVLTAKSRARCKRVQGNFCCCFQLSCTGCARSKQDLVWRLGSHCLEACPKLTAGNTLSPNGEPPASETARMCLDGDPVFLRLGVAV